MMRRRVRDVVSAPVAGLASAYGLCLLAVAGLRSATGDADLIWNAVGAPRVAAWLLGMAHGVPLGIRSTAGLSAEEGASFERLSQLLGSQGEREVVFGFSVLLVPLTILVVAGTVTAILARRTAPQDLQALGRRTLAVAAIYASGLAAAAALSGVVGAFEATLAPELGVPGARARIAVGIGGSALTAGLLGAVWGAAFAVAGGLSSPTLRGLLSPSARVLLRAWTHGTGAAAAGVAVLLVAAALAALVTGRTPGVAGTATAVTLLAGNAVAAAIVLGHGVSIPLGVDAGPLTGWDRLDLFTVGPAGGTPAWVWWSLTLVPLAAGLVAGRYAAARTDLPLLRIGLAFGGLWGLTVASIAMLLRVRVLASFSLGELDLGGGGAAADPVTALVAAALTGTATATLGAATRRRSRTEAGPWTCPACGRGNGGGDRFCVSCGRPRDALASQA